MTERWTAALPLLALLVAMVSIQSGASFAKQLFPALGAAGTSGLRVAFSAMLLWIVWRPWRTRLSRPTLGALFLYGSALGLMNLLFYQALDRIPLGLAVGLEFTGPLAVALAKSRRGLDLVWALLAALGIYLILPVSEARQGVDPVGVAYALGAGAAWGLYIIWGQRVGTTMAGGLATAWGMLFAALIALPVGVASAGTRIFDLRALPLVLVVAVLSSALPYSLEMFALKRLPSKTFSVLMSVEPSIAALSGFIFLDERLTVLQGSAILCVIAASFGCVATQARRAE